MAELAQATPAESDNTKSSSIRFAGSSRNLVPAIALIAAGLTAPVMGLTDVYFADAMATTFVIWGLLFLYMGLLDAYKTYEVTDESLIITSPFRFWNYKKEWDWASVIRMDVKVKQPDARLHAGLQHGTPRPAGHVPQRPDTALQPGPVFGDGTGSFRLVHVDR